MFRLTEYEQRLYDCKQQVNTDAEELAIMVSAFKESQLQIKAQQKTAKGLDIYIVIWAG